MIFVVNGKTSEKNAPIFVRGRGRGHLPPPKKKCFMFANKSLHYDFCFKREKTKLKNAHIFVRGRGS